jgi:transposase-like protein
MYSRETRVLLRHYLEQGVGKTELARRLGVSRRTVYHWIETAQLDRDLDDEAVCYKPRPAVGLTRSAQTPRNDLMRSAAVAAAVATVEYIAGVSGIAVSGRSLTDAGALSGRLWLAAASAA